ncbi:MAG: hypothetical protein M3O90_06780, partial [Actinomycetota bacterium]|nr:hypothetical protein [Actinomycetota bacterium]
MATIDDWQILHALHAADEPWDEDPWDLVTRVADRRGETAADLYARERLKPAELRRSPLHDDDK